MGTRPEHKPTLSSTMQSLLQRRPGDTLHSHIVKKVGCTKWAAREYKHKNGLKL